MLTSRRTLGLPLGLSLCAVLSACQPSNPTNQQLSAGLNHACSLDPLISGVQCWGDNKYGQTNVPELTGVTHIVSGDNFNCAAVEADVNCWGENQTGQLDAPALMSEVELLAAGAGHVCLLAEQLHCWGYDQFGQAKAPQLSQVSALALGDGHSCAVAADKLTCWGDNRFGQLNAPALPSGTEVLSLVAAGNTSCVLLDIDGESQVRCWGEQAALAGQVSRSMAISAIDLNAANLCLLSAGQARCVGDNSERLQPRDLSLATQIAVGQDYACARHQQGVACWGQNDLGQTDYDAGEKHTLYRSEVVIEATPEQVWAVLMDLENYPLWNPFTIAMKSELKVGAAMEMKVAMQPWLVLDQTEHIRLLEPNYKACWGINTDSGEYSRGERCQWLEVVSPTQTRYITEDLIEGKVTPMVTRLFGGSLTRGFDGVAQDLKQRVESLK